MNRKQRRAQGKAGQSTASGASAAASDPATLHEAGIEAYRAGDLGRAAALIVQAIEGDGGVPSFHYNLGIVLKAASRLEDAAACYQRALALKPDYAEAHNNLGNVWKALGKKDEAMASFAQALVARPGYGEAHYNLGVFFGEAGEKDKAEAHLQACLAQDPADSRGVRMLLAHLGQAAAPQRASQAQMIQLYDQRARSWDSDRSYHGHELVAQALRACAGSAKLDILDAGCGTGLAGALVRDIAGRLDGVDISQPMLERAHAKLIYDALYQEDLVKFLSGHKDSYDAIISAATLIHFGDLRPAFRAAAPGLRSGGLFVFTLFFNETDDADFAPAASFDLARHGCYRHAAGYVKRLAQETRFAVDMLERAVHEHDLNGQPVPGLVGVLRRV
ncbi:MAG TPA: tetratricopeptide repeat protein [Rhizomicrobium sp.]|jgi:predicted TPR repeat methyltransferase|nr:tetratricopeptide repeat protein [Rhizomicrobium sp.]